MHLRLTYCDLRGKIKGTIHDLFSIMTYPCCTTNKARTILVSVLDTNNSTHYRWYNSRWYVVPRRQSQHAHEMSQITSFFLNYVEYSTKGVRLSSGYSTRRIHMHYLLLSQVLGKPTYTSTVYHSGLYSACLSPCMAIGDTNSMGESRPSTRSAIQCAIPHSLSVMTNLNHSLTVKLHNIAKSLRKQKINFKLNLTTE